MMPSRVVTRIKKMKPLYIRTQEFNDGILAANALILRRGNTSSVPLQQPPKGHIYSEIHFFCVIVTKIPKQHNLSREIFTLAFQNSFRESPSAMRFRQRQLKCELDAVHMKGQATVGPETGAGHSSNTHHSGLLPPGRFCLANDPEHFK